MKLQEQLKKDLSAAIKTKDEEKKSAVRVILGEFGRSGTKEIADDEAVKILKKLIKSEKELLEKKGETENSAFIAVCESYLPAMVSEAEIIQWIQKNIDFSQFKNKLQAMGPVIKHFGSSVDGSAVKEILQKL